MLTCQISSRSVYFVALCWRKPPIFAVFWTSAFSGIANWQLSEKVEDIWTTTNLSLSNGIVLQCHRGEIGLTNSDVQKRVGQTNRQKKLNVFGRPSGGLNLSHTKLGPVIEDLEHVLAPLKLLEV